MSTVWRNRTREIKAGALFTALLVAAVGLCKVSRIETTLQPRGLASQAPAVDQAEDLMTLDTEEIVQVPADCLAPVHSYPGGTYTFLNRFPVSRRERRRELDAAYVKNQVGASNVVWVKPECRTWLENKVNQSLRRYFMSGNAAAFPYRSSTLRPYCGKTPEVVTCRMPLPIDRSVLMRTNQTVVPAPLIRGKSDYQNGRLADLRMYAIEESSARSDADYFAYQFGIERDRRGREGVDFVRQGKVRYLSLAAPPRQHEFLNVSALAARVPDLHLRIADRFEQQRLRNAVMRFVELRSSALGGYWERALHFNPRAGTWGQGNPSQESPFAFMESHGRIAEALSVIRRLSDESWYDDVLVGFTSGLMSQIGDQLMKASNSTELMRTASYWWAVRSLQLALSCDEPRPDVFTYPPGGEQLIGLQWHYQSCRREYMQIAADNVSRWAEQNRGLALESITWQLVRVFGSRAERLNLYSSMLDQIQQQFQRGVIPSAQGLSVLFFELDQLLHEKKERRLLLWNKLEDASPEDLAKIDEVIAKYRSFFSQVGAAVARREFTLADHYGEILNAWRYFGSELGLPDWNTLEDVRASGSGTLSLSRLMETLEQDFSGSTPVVAVASALDRSRWTFENVSPSQQGEVCRAWLNFSDRYRRGRDAQAFPRTTVDTDQMGTPHCLGLIPAWLREPSRENSTSWGALISQCERGHRLSCATLIAMGAPEVQQWSLQRWEQILRPSQPMDLLSWRYFVRGFASRPDVRALAELQPAGRPSRSSRPSRARSWVIPPEHQELARLISSVSADTLRHLLQWVGAGSAPAWNRFKEEALQWHRSGTLLTEHTLPENPSYALGRYSVWNGDLYTVIEKLPEAMASTCLIAAGSQDTLDQWGRQFVGAYADLPIQMRELRTGFGSIFQSPKHCDFPTRHEFGVRRYLSSCAAGMRVVNGRNNSSQGQGELEDRYDPFSSR